MIMAGDSTSRLSKDGHFLWVSTEECNVSLNPSHRLLLVFEAQISCQIS